MKGHIKITDKVYFVPEGLPKPYKAIYWSWGTFQNNLYQEAVKAYEASKKTVEVSNEYAIGITATNQISTRVFIYLGETLRKAKHNQPCEAEVTDKAIITKLL